MCKEIVLPGDEGKVSSRARIRTVPCRKVVPKRTLQWEQHHLRAADPCRSAQGRSCTPRGPHRERPEHCLHVQGGPPVPPERQHQRNSRVVLGPHQALHRAPCCSRTATGLLPSSPTTTRTASSPTPTPCRSRSPPQPPSPATSPPRSEARGRSPWRRYPARCSPSRLQVRHKAGGRASNRS